MKLPLTFRYLTPEVLENGRVADMLDEAIRQMDPESIFAKRHARELEGLDIKGKIQVLQRQGHNALLAFRGDEPLGLIAFQDHGKDRHAYRLVIPQNRGSLSLLRNLVLQFIESSLNSGVNRIYASRGLSGEIPNTQIVAGLRRIEQRHARRLGIRMNTETGLIEKL